MVLSIAAFCIRIYLRSSTFQVILVFFLFEGRWSFWMASIRDFNAVIVFFFL